MPQDGRGHSQARWLLLLFMVHGQGMPQFHPIIYSVPDGGALGKTVEANDADEACRQAAASLLNLRLPAVDRALAQNEIEVIAVIKGDPQFAQPSKTPLFPAL